MKTRDDPAKPRLCLPPVAASIAPSRRLPDGTCDCHVHVFGSPHRYPLVERRSYTPPPASLEDYRAIMDTLGIARAVLIQPSVYGTDNSAMLDALAANPDWLRGIAVVAPEITDDELVAMHSGGIRGVRINRRNPGGLGLDAIVQIGRRIAFLGWHIELQIELSTIQGLDALVRSSPVPVVIDHLGLPDPREGVSSPPFRSLLRLLSDGVAWVKLSAPYRSSLLACPYPDLAPYMDSLLSARPDRLLWATDWPHPELWSSIPADSELVESSPLWNHTAEIRNSIFVDNPLSLYWSD
jgi:predicted TIM-barrel fold metal-dependent hydrolase